MKNRFQILCFYALLTSCTHDEFPLQEITTLRQTSSFDQEIVGHVVKREESQDPKSLKYENTKILATFEKEVFQPKALELSPIGTNKNFEFGVGTTIITYFLDDKDSSRDSLALDERDNLLVYKEDKGKVLCFYQSYLLPDENTAEKLLLFGGEMENGSVFKKNLSVRLFSSLISLRKASKIQDYQDQCQVAFDETYNTIAQASLKDLQNNLQTELPKSPCTVVKEGEGSCSKWYSSLPSYLTENSVPRCSKSPDLSGPLGFCELRAKKETPVAIFRNDDGELITSPTSGKLVSDPEERQFLCDSGQKLHILKHGSWFGYYEGVCY